ncbi:MAG: aldo/keto reductase [Elainella sp. Prado103]|jgi:aryl-alcohol dehydrogenase-like predicted oxidoreductase|nr:aldo/keto reductase [Elainella sp. Prado103]
METVTLGKTGIAVPPIGIGTWAWGDNLFWSYGKDYDATELKNAFQTAIESGMTLFDTAEIYGFGESERLLGQFIQQAKPLGDVPVAIATKYFPLPWRFNADAVSDALTKSLKRLQLPTVTLYQVHWPFDFFMGQTTLMQALADEVQQGRIQAIGVSNYSAAQMRHAHQLLADRGIPLAVNQVQYSLLARQIERNGVAAAAQELGITLLAYSPLAQGLLTGKYRADRAITPTGARQLSPQFSPKGLDKLEPLLNLLQSLGEQYDRTPAQVALNWLIAQGNVIPIPGAKNADQVRQNAGAIGWRLAAAEVEQLAALSGS